MPITRATLGFIFSPDQRNVLLIYKNRPAFQAGKLNGIGGKCEGEESFADCIGREVREETGLNISQELWTEVGNLTFTDWNIGVFCSTLIEESPEAISLTDEQIEWHSVNDLPANCISNLSWLIPLSLDVLRRNQSYNFGFSVEQAEDHR